MVPNFSDIQYFIEVSHTKNISRAAERLGITQPSLSSAIKRLENSIGTNLFVRNRTGVELTKAGKDFLTRSRQLLFSWEQLKTEVNKKSNEVSGQYTIGCHPSVGLYCLSLFLPDLVQNHPDLEIRLVHDLSRKITEGIISFEIDFGIVVNPVKHPDLVIHELCTDEVLFWTCKNPSHTQNLNSKSSVLICDLNLIQTQKIINDLQKKDFEFKRIIQTSDLEIISDLTSAGVGIGIIPRRVASIINPARLKPLDDRFPSFSDTICLVYRSDFQKNKSSKIIIQSIRSSIK